MSDGTVRCWGESDDGQNDVPAGLKAISLSAGDFYSAAADKLGKVVTWGNTFSGQGDVPAGLGPVKQVACGSYAVLALLKDGTIATWGNHGSATAPIMSGVKQVFAEGDYFGALTKRGDVTTWDPWTGVNYMNGYGLTKIAVGYGHTVGLKPDGTVMCWGDNWAHQCEVPAGLNDVVDITAGAYFSAALKSDGTVVCWGDNSNGECNVPAGLTGVGHMAAGGSMMVTYQSIIITLQQNTVMRGQLDEGTVPWTPSSSWRR